MEEGSPGAGEEEWQESCALLSSHTPGPVGQSWADVTHTLPPTPWDTGLSEHHWVLLWPHAEFPYAA